MTRYNVTLTEAECEMLATLCASAAENARREGDRESSGDFQYLYLVLALTPCYEEAFN